MAEYTLGSGVEAKQRLNRLARLCRPATLALLESAGIRPGYYCLDVGSGSGDVTLDMARLVGPLGKVVGLDMDDTVVRLAREDAISQGVENVEFRTQSAESLSETGYDLVYARFLLAHLGNPTKVLKDMVSALQPGGVLVIEDGEFSASFSYPPDEAFTRFVRWSCETVRRRGANLNIGPTLPMSLGTIGLSPVTISLSQVPLSLSEDKEVFSVAMQQRRPAMLSEGVVTEEEFDEAYAKLRAFAAQPENIIAMPRVWQVCGCKS
jgi:SAM-dependent methyltransferase